MRIYLAGPLFTAGEREFNRNLRDALGQYGYNVWLPQEHEPRSRSAKDIFLTDVEGLDSSDVVLANMDGPIRLRHVLGVRIRLQEEANHRVPHRFPEVR